MQQKKKIQQNKKQPKKKTHELKIQHLKGDFTNFQLAFYCSSFASTCMNNIKPPSAFPVLKFLSAKKTPPDDVMWRTVHFRRCRLVALTTEVIVLVSLLLQNFSRLHHLNGKNPHNDLSWRIFFSKEAIWKSVKLPFNLHPERVWNDCTYIKILQIFNLI